MLSDGDGEKLLNPGDGSIQAVGPKSSGSGLANKALTIGRYGSLAVCAVSGGSGYAAGADVEVLVNQALKYFDCPSVPTGYITYSIGGLAIFAYSAFNMASSQKLWDDIDSLINKHLKGNGFTCENSLKIALLITWLVFGLLSAYSSASFTFNSISNMFVAFAVAGTNWYGTGMANREGLAWAADQVYNLLCGARKKDSQNTRTCCNTTAKAFLGLFATLGGLSGLAGITGNAMLAAKTTANKVVLLLSGIPPTLVFIASSFNGLNKLLLQSKEPEVADVKALTDATENEVLKAHSCGRKFLVPSGVLVPAIPAAISMPAATGVLLVSTIGSGLPTTILIIIVLLLGFLNLLVAFDTKGSSMANTLIDKGQKLLRRCCGRNPHPGYEQIP